jgi:hypothetical protein
MSDSLTADQARALSDAKDPVGLRLEEANKAIRAACDGGVYSVLYTASVPWPLSNDNQNQLAARLRAQGFSVTDQGSGVLLISWAKNPGHS